MADVEYLEEEPDGWAEAVAGWQQETAGKTFRMWGECPTCGHPSETVIESYRSVMAGPGKPIPILVTCDCGHAHADRPEGKRGCGRGAWLHLHPDDA